MFRLQLFHQLYEELLKLNIFTVNKPGQLRFLFDKISVNIRGLEALGVKLEQYGSLLIPSIMAKLECQEIRLKTFGRSTPCSILYQSHAQLSKLRVHRPQNPRYLQLECFLVPLQTQSQLFQNVLTTLKDISRRLSSR